MQIYHTGTLTCSLYGFCHLIGASQPSGLDPTEHLWEISERHVGPRSLPSTSKHHMSSHLKRAEQNFCLPLLVDVKRTTPLLQIFFSVFTKTLDDVWIWINWWTLFKCVLGNAMWEVAFQNFNLHVCTSLCIYSKYKAGVLPNRPKCKTHVAPGWHRLFECNKIQLFWRATCTNISEEQVNRRLQIHLCLLRNSPDSDAFNAGKESHHGGVGRGDSPSVSVWISLIWLRTK